jgi:hypothetical protein
MDKRGEGLTTKELIYAVAAILILSVVAFGVVKYFQGHGIPLLNWLPGFNNTGDGGTDTGASAVFRYNLGNGEVEYYDGVRGIPDFGDKEVNGGTVNSDTLKGDFYNLYFATSAREEGIISFPSHTPLFGSDFYKEGESSLNDQMKLHVKISTITNPLEFDGGYIVPVAKRGDIMASLVSQDSRVYGYLLLTSGDVLSLWLFGDDDRTLKKSAEDLSKINVMVLSAGGGVGASYISFGSSEQYKIARSGIISWRDSVLKNPMPVHLENDKMIYTCVKRVQQGSGYYLWSDLKNSNTEQKAVTCSV